jgi:hypothetical protein
VKRGLTSRATQVQCTMSAPCRDCWWPPRAWAGGARERMQEAGRDGDDADDGEEDDDEDDDDDDNDDDDNAKPQQRQKKSLAPWAAPGRTQPSGRIHGLGCCWESPVTWRRRPLLERSGSCEIQQLGGRDSASDE